MTGIDINTCSSWKGYVVQYALVCRQQFLNYSIILWLNSPLVCPLSLEHIDSAIARVLVTDC